MLSLFSSDFLIQSLKWKALLYNYGSASWHSKRSQKRNGNQNPWTADEPRFDDPIKRTDRDPCKHPNNTRRRKPWPCRNPHGPSKIPLNCRSPFCQPSQPRKHPANVPGNAAAGIWARAEAEHKEEKNMRLSKELYKQRKTLSWKQWTMSTYLKSKMRSLVL